MSHGLLHPAVSALAALHLTLALHLGLLLVRAEEAWEPVLLGGLIPIIGALGVLFIIIYAVRSNPENDKQDPPKDSDPTKDASPPSSSS